MNRILDSNRLNTDTTAFFLCDIQERFRPAIDHFGEIVEVAKRLVSASRILSVPLVVTEQYPKGLGETVKELDVSTATLKLEKTRFTMFLPDVQQLLEARRIRTVVLFGVEVNTKWRSTCSASVRLPIAAGDADDPTTHAFTFVHKTKTHVCVLQTAIDLLQQGYAVHVVADGCSSRAPTDRLLAVERLRQMGCVVTTHESVLFQLVGDKEHARFKDVQALVKSQAPDTGLLAAQSAPVAVTATATSASTSS